MKENASPKLKEAEKNVSEPRGVVAELAGLLRGQEIGDLREEYAEHLAKKYS